MQGDFNLLDIGQIYLNARDNAYQHAQAQWQMDRQNRLDQQQTAMQQREMAQQEQDRAAAAEERKLRFEALKMQNQRDAGGGVEGEKIAANLQRAMASAPTPEARAALEQRAYEMQQRGMIPRVEVTGPQTTPDQAAGIAYQANAVNPQAVPEPKTTSDITEFEAVSGMSRNDPAFGPALGKFLEKQNEARRMQINTGDLTQRTLGNVQASQIHADTIRGLIDKVYQVTNGNPDMFASLATRGQANAADWIKALGLPENATAEQISGKKAQVDQLLNAIKAQSTFKTEDGGEMSFGALTQGANLKDQLEGLRAQLDVVGDVNASRGVKSPSRRPMPVKPPKDARFELEKRHREGMDEATYQAALAALKAAGQ